MAKLTKKEYTKQRKELAQRQAEVQAVVDGLSNARAGVTLLADRNKETADDIQAEHYWQINMSIGEAYNSLHDLADMLGREIVSLDREWETRNWTAADNAAQDLVTQNID